MTTQPSLFPSVPSPARGDELDGESGEACYRCGSTVDVGRHHGRWICDDCDDEED